MNNVLIVCNKAVRKMNFLESDLSKLEDFASWRWLELEGGEPFDANYNESSIKTLQDNLENIDGLIISDGSPRINQNILEFAKSLRIIGDLEGDRFAKRIDLEEAWQRDVITVDTTQGSSYPVAEWALALVIISLKNAGYYFRKLISGDIAVTHTSDFGYENGELFGSKVGLIGCGHIGRRLIKFLRPFQVKLKVYDPYISSEMADILDFTKTSLTNVLTQSDVIVCLAPLTPKTKGMLGREELDLIPANTVFVNVSRGAIVDSKALIERLRQGDVVAGLDVFDPEPIPVGSEIRHLPNVFLSPHIASHTSRSRTRFFSLMVEEFNSFFSGHETRFNLTSDTFRNRTGM